MKQIILIIEDSFPWKSTKVTCMREPERVSFDKCFCMFFLSCFQGKFLEFIYDVSKTKRFSICCQWYCCCYITLYTNRYSVHIVVYRNVHMLFFYYFAINNHNSRQSNSTSISLLSLNQSIYILSFSACYCICAWVHSKLILRVFNIA